MTQATQALLVAILTVALIVFAACSFFGRVREPELNEDITAPSIEVIDDALRQVGDDRGAQDWLLDKRIAAMRRVP